MRISIRNTQYYLDHIGIPNSRSQQSRKKCVGYLWWGEKGRRWSDWWFPARPSTRMGNPGPSTSEQIKEHMANHCYTYFLISFCFFVGKILSKLTGNPVSSVSWTYEGQQGFKWEGDWQWYLLEHEEADSPDINRGLNARKLPKKQCSSSALDSLRIWIRIQHLRSMRIRMRIQIQFFMTKNWKYSQLKILLNIFI